MMRWTTIKTAIGWTCTALVTIEVFATVLAVVAVRIENVPSDLRSLAGPSPWFAMGLSTGSGVFIDQEGDMLTNEHVIAGCRRVSVAGDGFRAVRATLLAKQDDSFRDLAVLHVDRKPQNWLMFEDQPEPRQEVQLEFRAPGPMSILGFPVTMKGIVPLSAGVHEVMLRHPEDDSSPDHWQLNVVASIAPGNSGGPMVDGHGNLAGLVVRGTFPDRRSYAEGHAANSGDVIYGRYVLDWLRRVGIPAVVASPQQAAKTPGTVASAVVRVFCFGRASSNDVSTSAAGGTM